MVTLTDQRPDPAGAPLLEVRDLHVQFETSRGTVRAVDGISCTVNRGEIVAIVGESGCGKSVSSLAIMRLLAKTGRVTQGSIAFDGRDLLALSAEEMREIRGRDIAMIFQEPMTSLNPVLSIGEQVMEPLLIHMKMSGEQAKARAIELLSLVGITDGPRRLEQYPHQLSGGMRQRVMIAIALACNPRLLIADEATTALDVTIQAQIIELVRQLTRDRGTAVIWISHDLGVVAGLCSKVAVMYAGQIVETGSIRDVFHHASHGYTLGLMRSTPRVDAGRRRLTPIDGVPPNLIAPGPLCPFLPRCQVAVAECGAAPAPRREVEAGHFAACFADLRATWQRGPS